MYISENAIMLVALGVMFILAALGGVVIGSFFSKLNSITTAPAPVMAGGRAALPCRRRRVFAFRLLRSYRAPA